MATSEFGKAFREARASGDKTFTFKGKKYTTDLASDEAQSVGGKPKLDKYVPRDSDTRKGEIMTAKNAVGRDNYVRSGQKSFDTEREPEALAEPNKPGTNVRYENTDVSDMSMKRGGAVKKMNMGGMGYAKGGSASSRADGIAIKGKTRGKMC